MSGKLEIQRWLTADEAIQILQERSHIVKPPGHANMPQDMALIRMLHEGLTEAALYTDGQIAFRATQKLLDQYPEGKHA